VAEFRAAELVSALKRRPALVYLGNTGRTPLPMYRRLAESGQDFTRLRVRMLDSWILAPETGFDSLEHPGSFTRYVHAHWLALLDPDRRPRDLALLPEDLTTCRQIEEALAAAPETWWRPPHPVTGEPGAEIDIKPAATGVLQLVKRSCEAFETLLLEAPPDIVSVGVGRLPYPHVAFNNAPYTGPLAGTHLTITDGSVRATQAGTFGGPGRVPGFALTCGPATVMRGGRIWITATGAGKSAPVAQVFGDPRPGAGGQGDEGQGGEAASDFELRGSIAYLLRHPDVSLVLDEAAAAGLLADGGVRDLKRRYDEAGIRLIPIAVSSPPRVP
jgi:6-phosphogluconolactonase/glucosamine-6-phosphate isomerase/deaminase